MTEFPTDDKARKRAQAWTYLTEYFPDSFLAELEVAIAGNEQHNPGEPLHWAREKSTDQMNTAFRHMWDHEMGTTRDVDGKYHLAKAIWRLKAELQLTIEAERQSMEHDSPGWQNQTEDEGFTGSRSDIIFVDNPTSPTPTRGEEAEIQQNTTDAGGFAPPLQDFYLTRCQDPTCVICNPPNCRPSGTTTRCCDLSCVLCYGP